MKTFITAVLNIFFVILLFLGMALLRFGSDGKNILDSIRRPEYTKSSDFEGRVSETIEDVFDYIDLSKLFERNGKLDLKKVMAQAEFNGVKVSYSLDYLIQYARSMGYYLDEKNELREDGISTFSVMQDQRENRIRVTFRAYMPDYQPASPADGMITLGQLSKETLGYLAKYYALRSRLIDNPVNTRFYVEYSPTEILAPIIPDELQESTEGEGAGMESGASQGGSSIYSNDFSYSPEMIQNMGKYLVTDSETLSVKTNLNNIPSNLLPVLSARNPYEHGSYRFFLGIDDSFSRQDGFYDAARLYEAKRLFSVSGFIIALIAFLAAFFSLILAIYFASKDGERGLGLRGIDKIPLEIKAVLMLLCHFLARPVSLRIVMFLEGFAGRFGDNGFLLGAFTFLLEYFLFLPFCLSVSRTYKAGILWKNTLIYKFIGWVNEVIESSFVNTSRFYNLGLFLLPNIAGAVFSICLISVFLIKGTYTALFSAFCIWFILIAINIYTKRIRSGLKTAVDVQVKAERLKADLITNVSHDLKTPLTSIINYVDLMKREKIDNEKAREYLEILEQKSQRLKTLTEDLVEASKASSGNVEMEFTELNYSAMVQQALGEFEDRFQKRGLQIVKILPDEAEGKSSVMVVADGRRLWRVLENLLNNCCKYALTGSRVYIELVDEGQEVACVIKNISESPLNISPDELTERFVRGDVSRTTEGSGLGLSIAKSLSFLMGGELEIQIDGDLYKAIVRLKKPSASDNDKEQSSMEDKV